MTLNQKLDWLRKHDFEVDLKERVGKDNFWEAWDTLDYDGYRVVTSSRKEAIEEAYSFLSEQVE